MGGPRARPGLSLVGRGREKEKGKGATRKEKLGEDKIREGRRMLGRGGLGPVNRAPRRVDDALLTFSCLLPPNQQALGNAANGRKTGWERKWRGKQRKQGQWVRTSSRYYSPVRYVSHVMLVQSADLQPSSYGAVQYKS